MSYLVKQFKQFQKHFPDVGECGIPMRDSVGVYALQFERKKIIAYFVAKKNSLGGIVSIHTRLYDEMRERKRACIMAIYNNYHQFTHGAIKQAKPFENLYGQAPMINFPLSCGKLIQIRDENAPSLFEHDTVGAIVQQFDTVTT